MNTNEVFTKLAEHMLEGISFHEQAMNCFGFLTLSGYQKCQEYHYYSEIKNYRDLCDYYLNNYRRLLKIDNYPMASVIDSNFYKYMREDVDTNTIRTTTRALIKKWVTWETETKSLLEVYYKELSDLGEIAAALKISYFLVDVEKELKNAINKLIQLETVDYDIIMIQEEQASLQKKYKHKIACIKL